MIDEDIQKTADLLKQLPPGYLPYPIFVQVARLVALPIVEFVPLRQSGERIEVLLLARPDDDPIWPGLLHTPGTVVRATDLNDKRGTANWPAFDRIIKDELCDVDVGAPQYVGSIFHESKRGTEQAQLYWIEVLGRPKIGVFYDVDKLPPHLMESQVKFINEAVKSFCSQVRAA